PGLTLIGFQLAPPVGLWIGGNVRQERMVPMRDAGFTGPCVRSLERSASCEAGDLSSEESCMSAPVAGMGRGNVRGESAARTGRTLGRRGEYAAVRSGPIPSRRRSPRTSHGDQWESIRDSVHTIFSRVRNKPDRIDYSRNAGRLQGLYRPVGELFLSSCCHSASAAVCCAYPGCGRRTGLGGGFSGGAWGGTFRSFLINSSSSRTLSSSRFFFNFRTTSRAVASL